jgi:hypothetical protein
MAAVKCVTFYVIRQYSLDFIQEYVGFTGPHGISES